MHSRPFTVYSINTLNIVTQTAVRKPIKYSTKFATKAQNTITRGTEASVFYRLLGGHAKGNWHNAASAGNRIPPFRRGTMSSFSGINRYPLVHVMFPNRKISHVPLRPLSSLLPVTCILCPDISQNFFPPNAFEVFPPVSNKLRRIACKEVRHHTRVKSCVHTRTLKVTRKVRTMRSSQ